MGGWILVYEDNEKQVFECAVCGNPDHTCTVDKKTGKQTWGKRPDENYGM
jgi:transcription elongation factor Elf1